MLVRLNKQGKVYYDPINEVAFYGDKPVNVKASFFVRKWLGEGILKEVQGGAPEEQTEPLNTGEGKTGEGEGEGGNSEKGGEG